MRNMSRLKPFLVRFGLPLAGIAAVVVAVLGLMPQKGFETQGLIQAEETRLASTQGGRVKAIMVAEGQNVMPDQTLVQFEDTVLANRVAEAQNAVKQAQLAYEQLTQKTGIRDIQQAQARVKQAYQQKQLLLAGPTADTLSQARAKETELSAQLAMARDELKQSEAQVQSGVLASSKLDVLRAQVITVQNALNAAHTTVQVIKQGPRPAQRAIAQAELEVAQAQLGKLRDGARPVEIKMAAASVDKARIAAKAAADALADLTLKAPTPGVIGVLSVRTGELVQPGKPIVTLVKLHDAWVDIYVPEKLLPKLQLNTVLPLKSATYPDREFKGSVVFISPKSEFIPAAGSSGDAQESATFRVKLLLASGSMNYLRPGMKVTVFLP